jgi:DNA-binding transcriptional LysR family regulator
MTANALPDFSLRQLRAVLAVAEYRSFIAAAASLKISQPALTRTIKQIETAVGVDLFSRTTRQVAITAAGKEFVALAERLLNDLKIGIGSVRKHGVEQRGQIVLSSVLPLAETSLALMIGRYRKEFAGIEVHLREGMQGNVLDDVRSGVADVGIAYTNSLPHNFVAESLGVEALHVVFRVDSELSRARKVAMRDLKEAVFVSYPVDAHTRRLADSAAAAASFAPDYAVTTNRFATLMKLVDSGVGIAVVPSSERPSIGNRRLTSRPLAGGQVSRLGIVRLRERELNPPLSTFYELIKQWVRGAAPRRGHGGLRRR